LLSAPYYANLRQAIVFIVEICQAFQTSLTLAAGKRSLFMDVSGMAMIVPAARGSQKAMALIGAIKLPVIVTVTPRRKLL
jgi:hypothetical protein